MAQDHKIITNINKHVFERVQTLKLLDEELSNKIDQVRDILRTDDGISGAMDYTQAISWVLLK